MLKGAFSNVKDLICSAKYAYIEYSMLSLEQREELIRALRKELSKHIEELAHLAYQETGMGIEKDKVTKIRLAIEQTPGVEILKGSMVSGDGGKIFKEYMPYGVACAIHPSNNPCETLINNTISLLAAGNSVIHCAHARALEASKYVVHIINQCIYNTCGIENLVTILDLCLIKSLKEVIYHPDVDLVLSTGGSENARNAIKCGKKVIAGGSANPTFIVDETADLEKAASAIIRGAAFDHNITCVSEKNIVIVDSVADKFAEKLKAKNVFYTNSIEEMLRLSKVLLTEDMLPNKLMGGCSADKILRLAEIPTNRSYELIAVDTFRMHPFVVHELMIPMISMVRVADFKEALLVALEVEQHHRHTAGIHSTSQDRIRLAANILKTAIFIENGCSLDGLGICGVGGTGYTVANITGEGLVNARDFSRKRRTVVVDHLTDF